MKKVFSILWGIAILALASISFTSAYTQEQIEAYQWAYKYRLTTQPTIEQAKMNSPLTRQAFAKMVVSYLENVVWVNQSTSNSCYFPDESKITNDLKYYTKKTCGYQIMWSNWKNFNPTQTVDRAQLWTVFSRILWGDKHNVDGKWYYIYHVNALKDAGIMNNISNVQGVTAKRWDVLIMFKRMYEKYGSNIYLNGWNPVSTNKVNRNNKVNNSNLDVVDYNDTLIDIISECDDAMEDFSVVFDDEDPSSDEISKAIKNAVNICENAKDKAAKVWDFDGDSTLKDAIIMTMDANINFLRLFETSKPYWDDDNISEDDKEYQKLLEQLEKKSYIIEKSMEYLWEIQEIFAEKHWMELDSKSSNNSSVNNNQLSYQDDDDVNLGEYVVYKWKDGTVFYYNEEFLKALKATAEKKWESDLAKYLDVELKYYNSASGFEFDPEDFYETLWIDLDNTDPDSLTKKQKEEIAEKFWIWADGIAKKVREINEEYENDLEKVVKNAKNDKFWLKEKYNKTKDYLEYWNTFLDGYCKSLSNLLKIMLTAEEDEDNTEEAMRVSLSVISLTLDLKTKTDEYNKYNEWRVKDTIDLLWWELIY